MCSLVINGIPHGPGKAKTTCQLYMRRFKNGDTIWVEPFRAAAFPIVRDLVVDRSAFDHVIEAGGYIPVRTGAAPDANAIPIAKSAADLSMEAAACIGCGACVAACPNSSAMLFVAAKVSHLGLLPQGQADRGRRVLGMVRKMDELRFGNCTNHYECEAVCPAEISATFISRFNREYAIAATKEAVAVG
jgi:succinate dehydrogenase / fumarate reductase iron-sulfur subunit